MTTLQIDQVSKLYRASTFGGDLTPALRKVSFGIDHGEVVTLIGESGTRQPARRRLSRLMARPAAGVMARATF